MAGTSTPSAPRARLPRPIGRQTDVIYLDAKRDQVVLGTAGSGKTLMAIHRAAYLSDSQYPHAGRTLLVTYNNSLVSYLKHLAVSVSGNLDIRSYHHVARGYIASRGLLNGYNLIAERAVRSDYMANAIRGIASGYKEHEFFDRPTEFFLDELDWISGHGFSQQATYLEAERVGRLAPLQPQLRKVLWKIRAQYLELRAAGGQRFDWWELPTAMRSELATDTAPRLYRHVVVDEAQDLPPEAIRSLVDLAGTDGSVSLFADYAQQLYGQRTSYASCGLKIRKVEQFKENYRNSVGIARLAIATSKLPHFTNSSYLVTPKSPTVAGTPPTLFKAADTAAEVNAVRTQAEEFGKTGSVAILGRTWTIARSFAKGLSFRKLDEGAHAWADNPGIYIGTYHSAKGLEFDAVIMPGLDASNVPDSAQVRAFGEEEALERDARLIYVGITRARSELLATYTTELTEVLPAPASGYWLQTERSTQ